MAAFDVSAFGAELLGTLLWTLFSAVLAGLLLVLVDRMTPTWFNMRNIGSHPTATAVFAAGIMIGIGIIVAGVIMSG